MNEIMTMRTNLANQFADAGAKLLDFTMTAGALAAIPNTTPQQYAVVGSLESIQKVLPAAEPRHPQRRMRHGDRPTEPLSFEDDDVAGHIERAADPAPSEHAMAAALRKLIEMNRQEALDRYGDADKAESWSCVKVAREGLAPATASGDERRDFENWAVRVRVPYCDAPADRSQQWEGWKARAAVSAATKPTADLSSFDADHFKQLLRDVSNESYFCGINLDNDEAYAGHLALAEAADKAIIDYVQSLLATKPAAAPEVPAGAAVDANGTTYHNIAEIYHQAEECETLHIWLDEQGVPRADAESKVFSPIGRVMGMAQDAARFRWLNADHDDADVREQARSLAKRLGTSSYFAITRDIDAAMGAAAPAAIPAPTVPEGFVLMPKRLTRAMQDALTDEGWTWPDFLAAAAVITEDEYNELVGNEVLAPATPAAPADAVKEAREQALEEAAKLCDDKYVLRANMGHPREASTARALGEEIRALSAGQRTGAQRHTGEGAGDD